MRDSWYRITKVNGEQLVEYVQRNHCKSGSVRELYLEGAVLEEVEVMTKKELNQYVINALRLQA